MTGTQLDLRLGRELRDAAMEAVDDPPWRSFADRALLAVARRQSEVTSDDVWLELDNMHVPRPLEGRAMGPVMAGAVRAGTILPSGYTAGRNPAHHSDVMRTYRSTLYRSLGDL